eukprot:gene9998-9804_t
MTTKGDQILDRSLAKIGGKGLFIKELEHALLEGRADLAVHSGKDIPMDLDPEFQLLGFMTREDPHDAFVSNDYASLADLPAGAVVGSSSLRRQAQVLARYPHLKGALGLEIRAGDSQLAELVTPLIDPVCTALVSAERSVSKALGGSCQVPIAGYATLNNAHTFTLRGLVASPDGKTVIEKSAQASLQDWETAANRVIEGDEQGAHKALNQASKTGIETDLSYLIRAMSAMQADRYDVAEEILNQEKAKVGEHSHALVVLRGKVALSKQDFSGALGMLEAMDPLAAKLPQVQRLRMLALMGLGRWQDALVQYRACIAVSALTNAEKNEALMRIYMGLGESAGQDASKMKEVLSNAKSAELENMGVLRMLATGLLRSGLVTAARTLLETALNQNYNKDLLPIYHQVAVLEPREALPNVERLLAQQPADLRLLELAADLERLYEAANQGE